MDQRLMAQHGHEDEGEGGTALVTDLRVKVPKLYRVVLLNDDFTPMDFVVEVITTHFQKSADIATEIMLQIHYEGRGVCGVFPFDIADTKATRVMEDAKGRGFPLQAVVERES